MPGTPATSPRFGAPRIAGGDDFDIVTDLNAVTDTFDSKAALARRTLVTSLPGSPTDGDEILFLADATNRIIWALRYNASGGTYKWESIGDAAPLSAEVVTQENLAGGNTTYTDLTTVGPQVTAPLAGEYQVAYGAGMIPGAASGNAGFVAPAFGASAPSVNDEVTHGIPAAVAVELSVARTLPRRTVSAAGQVVKLRYHTSGATNVVFNKRHLQIRPLRVG